MKRAYCQEAISETLDTPNYIAYMPNKQAVVLRTPQMSEMACC